MQLQASSRQLREKVQWRANVSIVIVKNLLGGNHPFSRSSKLYVTFYRLEPTTSFYQTVCNWTLCRYKKTQNEILTVGEKTAKNYGGGNHPQYVTRGLKH
jgi:hypothetical protein